MFQMNVSSAQHRRILVIFEDVVFETPYIKAFRGIPRHSEAFQGIPRHSKN
jgi:hypothetical protein